MVIQRHISAFSNLNEMTIINNSILLDDCSINHDHGDSNGNADFIKMHQIYKENGFIIIKNAIPIPLLKGVSESIKHFLLAYCSKAGLEYDVTSWSNKFVDIILNELEREEKVSLIRESVIEQRFHA